MNFRKKKKKKKRKEERKKRTTQKLFKNARLFEKRSLGPAEDTKIELIKMIMLE